MRKTMGKAAELAGLPLGQMMTILTEFGVENRLVFSVHGFATGISIFEG